MEQHQACPDDRVCGADGYGGHAFSLGVLCKLKYKLAAAPVVPIRFQRDQGLVRPGVHGPGLHIGVHALLQNRRAEAVILEFVILRHKLAVEHAVIIPGAHDGPVGSVCRNDADISVAAGPGPVHGDHAARHGNLIDEFLIIHISARLSRKRSPRRFFISVLYYSTFWFVFPS